MRAREGEVASGRGNGKKEKMVREIEVEGKGPPGRR